MQGVPSTGSQVGFRKQAGVNNDRAMYTWCKTMHFRFGHLLPPRLPPPPLPPRPAGGGTRSCARASAPCSTLGCSSALSGIRRSASDPACCCIRGRRRCGGAWLAVRLLQQQPLPPA